MGDGVTSEQPMQWEAAGCLLLVPQCCPRLCARMVPQEIQTCLGLHQLLFFLFLHSSVAFWELSHHHAPPTHPIWQNSPSTPAAPPSCHPIAEGHQLPRSWPSSPFTQENRSAWLPEKHLPADRGHPSRRTPSLCPRGKRTARAKDCRCGDLRDRCLEECFQKESPCFS